MAIARCSNDLTNGTMVDARGGGVGGHDVQSGSIQGGFVHGQADGSGECGYVEAVVDDITDFWRSVELL